MTSSPPTTPCLRPAGTGPGAGYPVSRATGPGSRLPLAGSLLAGALCAAGVAAGGMPHGTLPLFIGVSAALLWAPGAGRKN